MLRRCRYRNPAQCRGLSKMRSISINTELKLQRKINEIAEDENIRGPVFIKIDNGKAEIITGGDYFDHMMDY